MKNIRSKESRIHSSAEKPFSFYECIIPDLFPYVPMHWHDEFETVYVKKGSIKMYINNGEYLLREGDGAFINSCIVHNYESGTPDTECVMPNVLFGAAVVSGYDELLHEKYLKPIVSAKASASPIFL